MIDLDLSGRHAIVTGASLGIGAAVVRLLADHGATVSFCARGEAAVAELAGYRPAAAPSAGTGGTGGTGEMPVVARHRAEKTGRSLDPRPVGAVVPLSRA